MDIFTGRYKIEDIKVGDFFIAGEGHMAVGWNSACDRLDNRKIEFRVREVKSVGKCVVPKNGYPGLRFEADQILGVFDSWNQAQYALQCVQRVWAEGSIEIKALEAELYKKKVKRFTSSVSTISNRTNR